jgi:hypothetical protein
MKITVILPVHNGENYLEESISSVLKQNFGDFELLVLDDDSIDRSAEIAQSTGDHRVTYSRNASRFGLFKTLNRGFTEARSDLVRIWAHDDVMLPSCLGEFYNSATEYKKSGMFYCNFFSIDILGKRTGAEVAYHAQRARTPSVATAIDSNYLFYVFGCLPGNISTVMLRKAVWAKVGGFLEVLQQAPDYDLWIRASEAGDVHFLPSKLIELRDHPLQLAKIGQKQMTTIDEEYPIYLKLKSALVNSISENELERFWLQNRGRQHMHWIARAILRGDFDMARRGWRGIKKYGFPARQLVQWAVSANGRFITEEPAHFFDRVK